MKERVKWTDVEDIVVPIVWLLMGVFLVGFLVWGSLAAPGQDSKNVCRGTLFCLSVPTVVFLLIGLTTWICNVGRK